MSAVAVFVRSGGMKDNASGCGFHRLHDHDEGLRPCAAAAIRADARAGSQKPWQVSGRQHVRFIDAKRRTRERFDTPDKSYVAVPEVDGIVTIEPEPLD